MMPLLLLLFLPIAELLFLINVGNHIGWVNAIFALVVSGILGAGLARSQGRYVLGQLQEQLARGQAPTNEVLHGILIFVGGILFLIPGFLSDIVAIFLVLPGSRHLMAAYLKRRFARTGASSFKIFTSGAGGGFAGGFSTGGFRTTRTHTQAEQMRDVTPKVIDVTPISSESQTKPEN
jgi:UPF0716 protein FxsA